MRILLDEDIPRRLGTLLAGHQAETVEVNEVRKPNIAVAVVIPIGVGKCSLRLPLIPHAVQDGTLV